MQHVDIALNRNRTTRGNDFFKLELHSHQEKYLKFGMTDYIKCGRVSLLRKNFKVFRSKCKRKLPEFAIWAFE